MTADTRHGLPGEAIDAMSEAMQLRFEHDDDLRTLTLGDTFATDALHAALRTGTVRLADDEAQRVWEREAR